MSDKKLNRKVSELSALYEVARILGSSLDVKDTSQKTFGILHKLLGLNRGTLVLKDPASSEFSIWAGYGLTRQEIERGRYKVGEGVTGKVLATGQPMIVPDIDKEPLFLNKTKARSDLTRKNVAFLCVPVHVQGETIGVLSVDRIFDDDSVSYDEDIRFLTVLSSLIGQAAKVARSVEEGRQALVRENIQLHQELKGRYRLANMVGTSKQVQEVYSMVEKAAPSRSTVLIRGESGTGKELIARALHYNSPRADRPFIRISCAALPETLLEGELFGHQKGAFTGAMEDRKGRFELADGGTLFLDEIGELSPAIQVKLLRVLQERKFERLGGTKTLSVDVRLVAATNRDLEKAIGQGLFREDLYYRLNVIPIFLPPLREREGDVLALVEHFLNKSNQDNGKSVTFSQAALRRMLAYGWPGNVRELENCVERVVVLSQGARVDEDDLPMALRNAPAGGAGAGSRGGAFSPAEGQDLPEAVRGIEKDRILKTLRKHEGIQTKAASELGLTVRQLGYKIKKYGIKLRVPTLDEG